MFLQGQFFLRHRRSVTSASSYSPLLHCICLKRQKPADPPWTASERGLITSLVRHQTEPVLALPYPTRLSRMRGTALVPLHPPPPPGCRLPAPVMRAGEKGLLALPRIAYRDDTQEEHSRGLSTAHRAILSVVGPTGEEPFQKIHSRDRRRLHGADPSAAPMAG
jgi:hypothetical protein